MKGFGDLKTYWQAYAVFGKWKWIVKAKSVSLFRNNPNSTLQLL